MRQTTLLGLVWATLLGCVQPDCGGSSDPRKCPHMLLRVQPVAGANDVTEREARLTFNPCTADKVFRAEQPFELIPPLPAPLNAEPVIEPAQENNLGALVLSWSGPPDETVAVVDYLFRSSALLQKAGRFYLYNGAAMTLLVVKREGGLVDLDPEGACDAVECRLTPARGSEYETVVRVRYTPPSGKLFAKWEGFGCPADVRGTRAGPVELEVTLENGQFVFCRPALVDAAGDPTFTASVVGSGRVQALIGGIEHPTAAPLTVPRGAELKVSAVAEPGNHFFKWACSDPSIYALESTFTVSSMTASLTCTARFEVISSPPTKFSVAATLGLGSVTTRHLEGGVLRSEHTCPDARATQAQGYHLCALEFPREGLLQFLAAPAVNAELVGWGGNCNAVSGSPSTSESFIVDDGRCNANFQVKQQTSCSPPPAVVADVKVVRSDGSPYPVINEVYQVPRLDPGTQTSSSVTLSAADSTVPAGAHTHSWVTCLGNFSSGAATLDGLSSESFANVPGECAIQVTVRDLCSSEAIATTRLIIVG